MHLDKMTKDNICLSTLCKIGKLIFPCRQKPKINEEWFLSEMIYYWKFGLEIWSEISVSLSNFNDVIFRYFRYLKNVYFSLIWLPKSIL